MEVKPGYKQTEVGVIPEEWDALRVCEFGSVITGGTPRTEIQGNWNGSYPWVTPTDITDQRDMWASERMISESGLRSIRQLPADSVLVTCIASIGKNAILRSVGGCNQQINAVVPLREQSPEFLYYSFESSKQYLLANAGMTATRILSKAAFEQLRFPIPPLPEQRAIAAALSDVDALLGGLDRLIAKKRDLKQAAMQQLLTGQTRLPGFSGAWEVKRLGEVGEISSAGVDKKLRRDEVPVRLVNYLDVYHKDFIYSHDLTHWVTAPTHQLRRCAVRKGDVFFTPTSETRNDIGLSAVAMEDIPDAAYSYHVARLRLHEPWDLRFRTYAFKTRAFLDQAETLCDGNGTRYVISQGKFRSMIVSVPPVAEQTAIAAVLSDMDTELAALEARRDKTRDLKQAMMQELLTGKTRLVNPETAHA